MKNKLWFLIAILLMLTFAGIIYSQQEKDKKMPDFKTEWQQVEEFDRKGLPKSALEVVNQIYEKAKKGNNSGQMVKALLERLRFKSSYEEDAVINAIQEMENELAESSFPVKPVLASALAEMYWTFYQRNRYKILSRTAISGETPEDIRVWDAEKFVEKSIKLYRASLAEANELKDVSPDVFDPILLKAPGSREFRPTLYDLLAHRAADFFMNDETYLTKPAYQFHIRGDAPFLPVAQFAKTTFETADSLSFKYYAPLILKELATFHIDDD